MQPDENQGGGVAEENNGGPVDGAEVKAEGVEVSGGDVEAGGEAVGGVQRRAYFPEAMGDEGDGLGGVEPKFATGSQKIIAAPSYMTRDDVQTGVATQAVEAGSVANDASKPSVTDDSDEVQVVMSSDMMNEPVQSAPAPVVGVGQVESGSAGVSGGGVTNGMSGGGESQGVSGGVIGGVGVVSGVEVGGQPPSAMQAEMDNLIGQPVESTAVIGMEQKKKSPVVIIVAVIVGLLLVVGVIVAILLLNQDSEPRGNSGVGNVEIGGGGGGGGAGSGEDDEGDRGGESGVARYRFRSEDFGFSVDFERAPEVSTNSVGVGDWVTPFYIFSVTDEDDEMRGQFVSVGRMFLPDGSNYTQEVLAGFGLDDRDLLRNALQGVPFMFEGASLVSSTNNSVFWGHSAADGRFSLRQGTESVMLHMRGVVVWRETLHIFEITSVGRTRAEHDAFVRSFRFED